MSHRPERKGKDCLNCGTIVLGKYCHVCGQENVEPKESFLGMVLHFFYDITHFDGKFFSTIKVLFRKPGLLTSEYVKGRRATYLNPIRMYVFTSAFFFLIFFTFFGIKTGDITNATSEGMDQATLEKVYSNAYRNAVNHEDSVRIRSVLGIFVDSVNKERDSVPPGKNTFRFGIDEEVNNYGSVNEYDSVQRSLPASKRHGWLRRTLNKKVIALNLKYKGREDEMGEHLLDRFLHMLPYLLFVSLPLYALFLKLLYLRRRKQYYYADHGLFLIHLYVYTFLLLLIFFLLIELKNQAGWEWLGLFQAVLVVYGIIYVLLAMRRFYNQGWGKTILKFILFNILCLFCLVLLFILFIGLTVYTF